MNLVELSSEAEHLKYPPDSLTTVLYEDELESVSSKVFSDEIVSKKYEISKDELEAIKKKFMESMKLNENWNGPKTFPPSHFSLKVAISLLVLYSNFLKDYFVESASIQTYAFNQGGLALEFITRIPSLLIKIENEAIKNPTIKLSYFLTDDENIEEEGEVSFPELNTLFVKFHGINDDL